MKFFLTSALTDSILDTALPLSVDDVSYLDITLTEIAPLSAMPAVIVKQDDKTITEFVKFVFNGAEVLIIRAQEGSTVKTWAVGDYIEIILTAETLNNIVTELDNLAAANIATQEQLDLTDGLIDAAINDILVNQNGDVLVNQNCDVLRK